MKQPRHQQPFCTDCRKRSFHGKQAAADTVAGMVRRGLHLRKAGWLRPYPCPTSGVWHIGHAPIIRKRKR